MSYPSFADGGSTDIALEQLERPLLNIATGPRVSDVEYTSLPTDTTSDHFERPSIDTGPGPDGQDAEYAFLPTDTTSDHPEQPSIDIGLVPKEQDDGYASLPTDEYATAHQAPTANWFYRITLDTWAPEALALFISAASILAITAILVRYGDKKSPEMSYGITLNAIVSILATASRSLLIFAVSMCIGQLKWCWYHERKCKVEDIQTMDAASRGPLGSAILLFSLRARPLASFGAVITILALAFDPFVQQILQYPSKPSVDLRQKSSIVRTSKFQIDPTSTDWVNAASAGIWSGAEQFAQQPSCPSGNCTWDEYSSIGWCSKCQDVTFYAKITNCRLSADGLDVDQLSTNDSCLLDFGHGTKFQVLNSLRTEMNENLQTNISTIFRSAVWPLAKLNDDLTVRLDNESYAGVTNPVVALGNAHVTRCDDTALDKGLCLEFAEECVLSLCTRQIQTSVVNGIIHSRTTNEDFGCLSQIYGYYSWEMHDRATHCWQASKPCIDIRVGINIATLDDQGFEALGFCSDGVVVQRNQSVTNAGSKTWTPTLQNKLLERLTGNHTAILETGNFSDWMVERDMTNSSYTMEYITANGLGPVLAGVAASLTQQALLANTSESLPGIVYTTEIYVAVDWPWLIYPATLVLSSIVLLILTAIHSHQCGLRIWKSSMLPLLYRTLDPDLLARQQVLHDVSTMTGVAGRAKVTLVETSREDGVVLTR